MDDSVENRLAARREIARYIGSMSKELSTMARKHRMDVLGYVLDMARQEAESVDQDFDQWATK